MPREEQGRDHRTACLGKDLERSSGLEPPDTDQVTGPGKAVTRWTAKRLHQPWGMWAWTQLVWDRDGTWADEELGTETQGLGIQTQLKSLYLSPPIGMVLPKAKDQPGQMELQRSSRRFLEASDHLGEAKELKTEKRKS